MREITTHAINPCNEALLLRVLDAPGPGGANHHYEIAVRSVDDPQRDGNPGQPRVLATLNFQNGAVKVNGEGVNGLTHEVLLAAIIDRMEAFQRGPYACDENAHALYNIKSGLEWLQIRTKKREARGVEGTHKV